MGSKKSAISVGEWIVTFIILAIPIVNIVMLFVWAFGGDANLSKKNYARATLILIAIIIVLYVILFISMGSIFMGSFR